jgi:CheY-like chemotaxis protein
VPYDKEEEQMRVSSLNGGIMVTRTLAQTHLRERPAELEDINVTARYCQLLAEKLRINAVEEVRVVLAAWMSALRDDEATFGYMVERYDMANAFADVDAGVERPIDADILELVRAFVKLKRSMPGMAHDVQAARESLESVWVTSPERADILKKFMLVLRSEEFLAEFDKSAGKILIVDPAEAITPVLSVPLTADGYEVEVVPDANAGEQKLEKNTPDLILASMDMRVVDGIEFCQKVKAREETAGVPVVLMGKKKGRRADTKSLRAGADDFLGVPVDLELMFLKLRKLLPAGRVAEEPGTGAVTGSLAQMGFVDMIQILAAGQKSSHILLSAGEKRAEVYIQNGEIVHAKLEDVEGADAFYKLMQWQDGTFIAQRCSDFPERTVTRSVMSLLMEGARIADESP